MVLSSYLFTVSGYIITWNKPHTGWAPLGISCVSGICPIQEWPVFCGYSPSVSSGSGLQGLCSRVSTSTVLWN